VRTNPKDFFRPSLTTLGSDCNADIYIKAHTVHTTPHAHAHNSSRHGLQLYHQEEKSTVTEKIYLYT
jgi:hypothetical protein